MARPIGMFPALLRSWRKRRGLTQLELALTARVSARHISFLETGRARPSEAMIRRLSRTMDLPLKVRNAMLVAEGFGAAFDETSSLDLSGAAGRVIEQMMTHQDPYPLMVMNGRYDVLRSNHGARSLLVRLVENPARLSRGLPNAYEMILDPELLRGSIVGWDDTVREVIARLRREALGSPHDHALRALLDDLIERYDLDTRWLQSDLSRDVDPFFAMQFRLGRDTLSFMTTLTCFSGPRTVMLDELCIESYYPMDASTADVCRKVALESHARGQADVAWAECG